MRLRRAINAWGDFFFAKQSPLPIAVFRILYGSAVIATLLLLRPDWLAWYGTKSWVTLSTILKFEPGRRINLLEVLPQTDTWMRGFFWFAFGSSCLLMVGLWTRVNSVLVFVCLVSIHQRNLYILHGGDTFLRAAGFFLMFAPAGATLSVDRLVHCMRGGQCGAVEPRSPWAQRMIQLQLSALYLVTFLLKLKGAPWRQGTALFYVYHLDELRRFTIPAWFFYPALLKAGTWLALVLEFSLGALIWVKKLRYVLLTCGVLFHLWLEYSLNIPMFQWDILAAYVLFVDPEDWRRSWAQVSAKHKGVAKRFRPEMSGRRRRSAELNRTRTSEANI